MIIKVHTMGEQLGALLVEKENLNDETVQLSLKGYIQNKETRLLRTFIDALQKDPIKHLILDMTNVEYISSAGMGFLVILTKEWEQKKGGVLVIFGMSEKQRAILETLGVLSLFKLVMTKEQALEAIGILKPKIETISLGVVSDSHGNLELLKKVCADLVNNLKVGTIIHLGDDYDDASVIDDYPVEKLVVPGVYSEHYKSAAIPKRLIVNYFDWRILLSHTPTRHKNDGEGDIIPETMIEQRKIDILLYGHTHIPNIEVKDGVLLVNPGNLKENDERHPPTYGLLHISKKMVDASIINATTGKTLEQLKYKKA